MNTKILARWMLCALFVVVACLPARAAPPQTISYQGFLTSSTGTPVNATVSVQFTLYDAASGGATLWTETQNVTVTNGNYSVVLGITPFGLPFNDPYFLGVKVGTDAEMTPRAALTMAPYAHRANVANNLGSNATVAGSQVTGALPNATIAGTQITGAITAAGVGVQNTFIGAGAGNLTLTGNFNTASGSSALSGNTSGSGNTASGQGALYSNTTGSSNTASGAGALSSNTTGFGNTASGRSALQNNETGGANTASGASALQNNTIGTNNTASGESALQNNTTGSGNIAIGSTAGSNLTTGSSNIAIGNIGVAAESNTIRIGTAQTRAFVTGIRGVTPGVSDALPVVVDSAGQLGTVSGFSGSLIQGAITAAGVGVQNTFIGAGAGNLTLTGVNNTASGANALSSNTSGFSNTASGQGALQNNTGGTENTASGVNALRFNTAGYRNTASGVNALQNNTTGFDNTASGQGALSSNTTSCGHPRRLALQLGDFGRLLLQRLDARGLHFYRALLLLVFVEQHRHEKLVAHRLRLPIGRGHHQARVHLGNLLRDQPVLQQPRAVVLRGLVAERHRPQQHQIRRGFAHVGDLVLEPPRRSQRTQLVRGIHEHRDPAAARRGVDAGDVGGRVC